MCTLHGWSHCLQTQFSFCQLRKLCTVSTSMKTWSAITSALLIRMWRASTILPGKVSHLAYLLRLFCILFLQALFELLELKYTGTHYVSSQSHQPGKYIISQTYPTNDFEKKHNGSLCILIQAAKKKAWRKNSRSNNIWTCGLCDSRTGHMDRAYRYLVGMVAKAGESCKPHELCLNICLWHCRWNKCRHLIWLNLKMVYCYSHPRWIDCLWQWMMNEDWMNFFFGKIIEDH